MTTMISPQFDLDILVDNPEIRRLLKWSRATVARREKSDPNFPPRVHLPGCRKVYRLRADVLAYIAAAVVVVHPAAKA